MVILNSSSSIWRPRKGVHSRRKISETPNFLVPAEQSRDLSLLADDVIEKTPESVGTILPR